MELKRKPQKISYAQKMLIEKMEARTFKKWLEEHLKSEYNFSSVFCSLHKTISQDNPENIIPINYKTIFEVREFIHPALWFYYTNEDKFPKCKEIKPFHIPKDVFFEDTIAMKYMNIIRQTSSLRSFASEHDIDFFTVQNFVLYKKTENGRKRHVSFPPNYVIYKLRDIIPPEDWFIFPDEV